MTTPIAETNHVSGEPLEGSPTPTIPIGIPESPKVICPGLEELSSTISGDDEQPQPRNIPNINASSNHRKELSNDERLAVYAMLLVRSEYGKLKATTTREMSEQCGVGIRTIQRIWKRARDSGQHQYANGRVQNCGRKRVDFNLERIKNIPLRKRTTLRSLAAALGVSKSYLHVKLKECVIRQHSNAIRPILTDENLESRVNHCLASFDLATVPDDPTFKNMDNVVRIDKKWFYLTKRSQTYYLLHDEEDPVRIIKKYQFHS